MKILITGASGYIGRHLALFLLSLDHSIFLLSQDKNKTNSLFNKCNLSDNKNLSFLDYADDLPSVDVIINLAGESISSHFLTKKRCQQILLSRLNVLNYLKDQLKKTNNPTPLLLQASALGIYANTDIVEDENAELGCDCIANICKTIEQETLTLKPLFQRIVLLRLGIVLSSDSPFILKIQKLPKLKLIGKKKDLGWISLHDVLHAILFIINNDEIIGPCNLCAPNTASAQTLLNLNKEYSFLPSLPLPTFFLNFGDKRGLLINKNQTITPSVLLNNGFKFKNLNLARLKIRSED